MITLRAAGHCQLELCGGGGGGGKGGEDPRGGALRYQMATHCQMAAQSCSSEHQNIGAVSSFEGKKGGRQL